MCHVAYVSAECVADMKKEQAYACSLMVTRRGVEPLSPP